MNLAIVLKISLYITQANRQFYILRRLTQKRDIGIRGVRDALKSITYTLPQISQKTNQFRRSVPKYI